MSNKKQLVEFAFEQISGIGKFERDDAAQLIFQPIGNAVIQLQNQAIFFTEQRPYIEDVNSNEVSITDYQYKILPEDGIVFVTKKYNVLKHEK